MIKMIPTTIHEGSIDDTLPLMECFYTIQGEGYWQGHAAFFIRLAGCNVGCRWCDVKESWDASIYTSVPISEIAHKAMLSQSNIAVITGGEPLMYPLDNLCKTLQTKGIRTHLETSGAYKLSGHWDWICFSPKKFKKPHSDLYKQAHELKIIIYNLSDFEFAEKHASLVNSNCKLYLQPEWSKKNEVIPHIIAYVKSNPRWAISLQIHKYMDIP